MVVPAALKAVRLKPGRNFTGLARLATEFGWKHEALVVKMEDKRKVRSAEFYATKKEAAKKLSDATKAADTATVDKALAAFGY